MVVILFDISIIYETLVFQFKFDIFLKNRNPISLVTTTSRAKCARTSYTIMKFELVSENNTYQLRDSTEKKKKFRFSITENISTTNFFFASHFILKIKKNKKIGKTFIHIINFNQSSTT